MSAEAGRRRRPRESSTLLRRTRLAVFVAALGVATVAIPPLIAPHGGDAQSAAPPSAEATPSPATPSTQSLATAQSTPSTPSTPGVPACAATGGVVTSLPTCAVYTTALGTGWRIESAGVKVVAAGTVPGTDRVALRVEPQEKAASVALVAAEPFTMPAGAHLKLSVYGGRVNGTVLRVSTSATMVRDTSRVVMLTAPVDVWSTFSVAVDGAAPVRRVDLVIATDMVPHAYRFFVDDVAFGP